MRQAKLTLQDRLNSYLAEAQNGSRAMRTCIRVAATPGESTAEKVQRIGMRYKQVVRDLVQPAGAPIIAEAIERFPGCEPQVAVLKGERRS